jgi:FixJ family two-component response regulator
MVVNLVVCGMLNKQIASKLGASEAAEVHRMHRKDDSRRVKIF